MLNCLSTESIQCKTHLDAATGQRPDILALMAFHWYEPVYFKQYKSTSANPYFPSEFQERFGRMVGIAEHKGDSLALLVLDLVPAQGVVWSELHSGLDSNTSNLHTILALDGSTQASRKTIKSHTDSIEMDTPTLLLFSPGQISWQDICTHP
jgi:hypothetical protein